MTQGRNVAFLDNAHNQDKCPFAWYCLPMISVKKYEQSFHIQDGNFADAYTFVENMLTRKDISKQAASEALLVFESLMQKLVDWGLDENTVLDISGVNKLGDLGIRIGFDGRMFTPYADGTDSLEDRILKGHDDKLDFSYRMGYNSITISVRRAMHKSLIACAVATLCAFVSYTYIHATMDAQGQTALLTGYVFPIEKLYTNAALMVGAPMTFFSLLRNLTSAYITAQRDSSVRRLQVRTLGTSVLAIILAFVSTILTFLLFSRAQSIAAEFTLLVDRSFAEIITELIPPSIFEPFEAISPVPLMVVALLATYAMCSAGKHFDFLQQTLMACYTIFSRMLHVVIAVLPFFCFFAVLDMLIASGYKTVLELLGFCVAVIVALSLLFAAYAIRLRAAGIKVIPFVRDIFPLIHENVKIGSAIDAAPYNIRFCSRTLKMNRQALERNLPVLAQINLDGNCFIIMYFTMVLMYMTNTATSPLGFVSIALLILLLSYGAPNQPGSILIGILIVTMYLGTNELLCTAIFAEAFLGTMQNLVNVIGDIVIAAIEDKKQQQASA